MMFRVMFQFRVMSFSSMISPTLWKILFFSLLMTPPSAIPSVIPQTGKHDVKRAEPFHPGWSWAIIHNYVILSSTRYCLYSHYQSKKKTPSCCCHHQTQDVCPPQGNIGTILNKIQIILLLTLSCSLSPGASCVAPHKPPRPLTRRTATNSETVNTEKDTNQVKLNDVCLPYINFLRAF